MRLLILTFYYPPDLSAGSFRVAALVKALAARMGAGAGTAIDVLTTRPNRYRSFPVDVPALEQEGIVRVRRVPLPVHQSGMFDQSRAFAAFTRQALRLTRHEPYDGVVATSSRLMTAVLGSWISRSRRAPLYLDIRDILVDTMREVLSPAMAWLTSPGLRLLERFAVRRARRVNLVSGGFAEYFRTRYPDCPLSFFTNGVDDEFVDFATAPPVASGAHDPRRTVVYAGNIGEGQGLHEVIPELAERMSDSLRFRIIGDGGRRRELHDRVTARRLENVSILPPVNRERLMEEYRAADVLFLHLNEYDAFRKVLPSKVFEYAATGKPIWAGVGGYAAEFLRAHVENVAIFPPCDAGRARVAWDGLDFAPRHRAEFVRRFARPAISAAMAADILEALAPGRAAT